MRARAAFLFLPAFFAACGAFDAETPGGSSADAGVPEGGALSTTESGATDASDAGHISAPGDAGGFCQGVVFCDDFERIDPQGDWTDFDPHGDTVVLPVAVDAPHGTQNLQIFVAPKSDPEAWSHTRFFRPVTPGASRVVDVKFHFRAPALPEVHHANLATLSIAATPPLVFVLIVNKDNVIASVSYDNTSYADQGSRPRRVNQWDTAHFVLDLDKSTVSADLEDGPIVTTAPVTPGKDRASTVGVEFGPAFSDFTTSYSLDFDALEVRSP